MKVYTLWYADNMSHELIGIYESRLGAVKAFLKEHSFHFDAKSDLPKKKLKKVENLLDVGRVKKASKVLGLNKLADECRDGYYIETMRVK